MDLLNAFYSNNFNRAKLNSNSSRYNDCDFAINSLRDANEYPYCP